MKSRRLVVALVVLFSVFAVIGLATLGSPSALGSGPGGTPTPHTALPAAGSKRATNNPTQLQRSNTAPTGRLVPVETSGRLQLLSNVSNISIADLKKKSPAEVDALFEKYATALGMDVYHLQQNSDGSEQFQRVVGSGAVPQLTHPVPTPQSKLPKAPSTTYSYYFPYISNAGNAGVEVADITNMMSAAKSYIDALYEDAASRTGPAVVKEYPGCPVAIDNMFGEQQGSTTAKRLVGDYLGDKLHEVGKIVWYAVGYDYELSDLTFEEGTDWGYGEPKLSCDVYYSPAGNVNYQLTNDGWTGDSSDWENVIFQDEVAFEDIWDTYYNPVGATVSFNMGLKGSLPAHRYTIRHATDLVALMYSYYPQLSDLTALLNTTIGSYGFNSVPDIYAPMFESGQGAAVDYFYTNAAYHDCDLTRNGMNSTLPYGFMPHRYGYESKVCLTRDGYILLSREDYLSPALQAIHVLNKFGSPDYSYPNPNPLIGGNTTPRQAARYIESHGWNGYGISALGKDAKYASGVRTNAFLALESLLGYKYGDSTSRQFADNTVSVLKLTQWGRPPFGAYQGVTADDGLLLRPNHYGGELLSWYVIGTNAPIAAKASGAVYALPPRTYVNDVLDLLGMPNEVDFPTPSNAESTATMWAALRLYLKYKDHVQIP